MKVAIVVNELNIRGGTHKQVLRLCQYLREKKIDFVLCTKYYDQELTYKEFSEFDVKYLSNKVTEYPSTKGNIYLKIKNRIDKYEEEKKVYELIPKDVDIINVHDDGFKNLMNLAKKDGKRVIWQVNDLPGCFGVGITKSDKDCIAWKVDRYFYTKTAKKIDKITVNVSKNKNRIEKEMGVPAKVLYCGVDRNENLKIHDSIIDKEEVRILSTGVFFPYRNYESLVNCVSLLKNKGQNVRLDIIGSTTRDPNYASKIENMVKDLQVEERVKIWGQVDEEQYNELFNSCDIFAFLNIDQSWGLAVFEAMSCGMPTLVSNSVGAIELLEDGRDSIIVDPCDIDSIVAQILKLKNEKEYYHRISENAANAVKEYTWDKLYCEPLVEIYKS